MKRALLLSTVHPSRFALPRVLLPALLPVGQGILGPFLSPRVSASYGKEICSTTLTVQRPEAQVGCDRGKTASESSCAGAAALGESDFRHQGLRYAIAVLKLNGPAPAFVITNVRAIPESPWAPTLHSGTCSPTRGDNFQRILGTSFFTTNADWPFSDTVELRLTFLQNPARNLDATLGPGGRLTTDFKPAASDFYAVTKRDDGKIVGAGCAQSIPMRNLAVARYLPNGSPHTGYRTVGRFTNVGDPRARGKMCRAHAALLNHGEDEANPQPAAHGETSRRVIGPADQSLNGRVRSFRCETGGLFVRRRPGITEDELLRLCAGSGSNPD